MKLSTRSRYGLRAMYDLAVNQAGPVSLKSIATRQSISEAYLEQLFASLKRAKLVKSSRGAAGGYELMKESKDISVGEILNALEGSTCITDCVGGYNCENACSCPSHPVFAKVQKALDKVLSEISLADMVNADPIVSKKIKKKKIRY